MFYIQIGDSGAKCDHSLFGNSLPWINPTDGLILFVKGWPRRHCPLPGGCHRMLFDLLSGQTMITGNCNWRIKYLYRFFQKGNNVHYRYV